MFREIKKKQIILDNRKPYQREVSQYIQQLNLLDWVYSSMCLDGSRLERNQIERILNGEYLENASLMEHGLVERYNLLIKYGLDMLEMSSTLNFEMLINFQKKLSGDPDSCCRKSNPVLISLDYNPPHPSEIKEQIELLMNWFYSEDAEANPILKAARLHHRIIETYPFETYSEAVARAAMYYFLMGKGYPPFEIDLNEQEYNASIIAYLQKENIELFYSAIERSLFKKMEVLMQLTAMP